MSALRYGDTPGIRLSPSLGWPGGPPPHANLSNPKSSPRIFLFSFLSSSSWPIYICHTLFNLPGHSESSPNGPQFTSPPFSVLDRLLTRLSALYCQRSCQATILLENTGLLQLAQVVTTLQIQALKKQNNSQNDSNNFPQ